MPNPQAGQTTAKKTPQGATPELKFLLLSWLLPGLGHMAMGDRKRGLILCVTICSLFVSGLLIGGMGVLDYRLNRAWFFGQMFNGPAVVLAVTRAQWMMAHPDANPVEEASRNNNYLGRDQYLGTPDDPNVYQPSFGRPNEVGILYTALAGLLNLFIFYDVLDRSALRNAPKGTEVAS